MEPALRTAQVLKQEAEEIGLQGKDIAEYVREQQALDREERAAWRESQKRKVEIRMAELQAEDKKRANETRMAQIEPALRTAQVLKQEAEEIGLQGKDIAEYVREQQALDREERAAWRESQKRKVEIRMAELQAEDKKRANETRMAQIEAAKEQAKIEAEKELALKELELKAQQNQASASLAATPPPRNKDAKSPKLPSFIDEKDELDSYLPATL